MVQNKTEQCDMHRIPALFTKNKNMTWSYLEAVSMDTAQPTSSILGLK